jgi:hypothetical protein
MDIWVEDGNCSLIDCVRGMLFLHVLFIRLHEGGLSARRRWTELAMLSKVMPTRKTRRHTNT